MYLNIIIMEHIYGAGVEQECIMGRSCSIHVWPSV